MENYEYYGYISNCEYHDFFQYIFEEENLEIAKKILSRSEMLDKDPRLIKSDYFIEDSKIQKQGSLRKDLDKHTIKFNEENFNDNVDYKTKEVIKYYSNRESNYGNELNDLGKNHVEPIMRHIIIDINIFEEKNDYVYINLGMGTIVLLALLLDSKLPIGIPTATLGALGINTTLITKLDEVKGENCILLEICSKKNREILSDFYKTFNKGECINNHFNCKYKKDGKCTITEDVIKKVCDYFVDRNIIKLKGNYYKYMI